MDDIYYIQCKLCNSGTSLSSMGVGAAKKHMTDPKGKRWIDSFKCIKQDNFCSAKRHKVSIHHPPMQSSAQVSPPSVSIQATSSSVSAASNETAVTKSKHTQSNPIKTHSI